MKEHGGIKTEKSMTCKCMVKNRNGRSYKLVLGKANILFSSNNEENISTLSLFFCLFEETHYNFQPTKN